MYATDFDSMTGFMQTRPQNGHYDDGRDARLDQALQLLDDQAHRRRNGLAFLAIVVALACSAVLLTTIVAGGKPAVEKVPVAEAAVKTSPVVPPASESAAFELSGKPIEAVPVTPAGSER